MSTPNPLQRAFPEARDLLGAIGQYWGRNGWLRSERNPLLCFAACPACKSKPLRRLHRSAGYPLLVQEGEAGGYLFIALCHCPEWAIVAALGDYIVWSDFEERERAIERAA